MEVGVRLGRRGAGCSRARRDDRQLVPVAVTGLPAGKTVVDISTVTITASPCCRMHGVRLGRQRARHLGNGSTTDSSVPGGRRCHRLARRPHRVRAVDRPPVITRSPSPPAPSTPAACPLARCRPLAYVENAGATAIAPNATASDAETNWNGGSLAVQLSAGSEAIDTLASAPRPSRRIRNQPHVRRHDHRHAQRRRRQRHRLGDAHDHVQTPRRPIADVQALVRALTCVCERFRQSSAPARTRDLHAGRRRGRGRLGSSDDHGVQRQRRARARRGRADTHGYQRKRYRQRGADHRKHHRRDDHRRRCGRGAGHRLHRGSSRATHVQFMTDGATWNDIGTVAGTSALLLRSMTRCRFVPNGVAAPPRASPNAPWDQTAGTAGTKVDASTAAATRRISSATDTANLTVAEVTDPPPTSPVGELSSTSRGACDRRRRHAHDDGTSTTRASPTRSSPAPVTRTTPRSPLSAAR